MRTKYVLILVIALFTQAGYAQKGIDKLFSDFSKVRSAKQITMGDFSMKIVGLVTDVMGVDGIEILSLDECEHAVKSDFQKAVKGLKDSGFETMVTSNEGDKRTRVLVKMEEDTIRELVLLTTGGKNALIRIKGNIKPSDIDSLVNKHKNG